MEIIAIVWYRTPAEFLVSEGNSVVKWSLKWAFMCRRYKSASDFCLPIERAHNYFGRFYDKIQDTVRRLYEGMGAHI